MAPLLGAGGSADSFAALGQAFQLTNFIRDVREDFALDRIYLPGHRRGRAGRRHRQRRASRRRWPSRSTAHASCFARAPPRWAPCSRAVRPGMRMARAVYVRVLDRVERLDYDVLGASAGLRPWEAAGAALGSLRARA